MLRTLFVRTVLVGLAFSALVTSTASAATRTWSGGGVDANWATPLNWVGGVAPTAGDALIFDGFGRLTNSNNLAVDTNIIGLTFAPTAGAFNLGGNRITLGGNIADNTTLLTQTIALQLLLNANRNVDVTGQGVLVLSGAISDGGGGFGLNKTGAGLLTLSGTNAFTGPINITGGTLSAGSAANLGAGTATGAITINGATFQSTGDFAIPATRGIRLGPAGSAGSGTIETLTGSDITYSGVIANNTGGTGSLNKLSFGSLLLSGANTYTGTTALKNGTITLGFSTAGAPTSNIINSVSPLVMGGANAGLGNTSYARIIMNGAASTANTQTFASTMLDVGYNVLDVNAGATGGSATLNLGAISRVPGSTLVFDPPTAGAIKTTTTNTNGILGGWATVGNDVQNNVIQGGELAAVDGSGNVITYTGYTAAPLYNLTTTHLNGAVASTDNVRMNDASPAEVRVAANGANVTTDINTFTFQNDPGGSGGTNQVHTLTIGAGNTLRLGQYGSILRQSTGTNNNLIIGGGGGIMTTDTDTYDHDADVNTPEVTVQDVGTLTAGGAASTPGEIVFNISANSQTTGTTRVWSRITNNGSGAVSVVKTGAGSMKLDGHNTFSGGLYLLAGRLQFSGGELAPGAPANLPPTNQAPYINPNGGGTGPIHIMPGAQLFPSGAGANTAPGTVTNPIFMAGNGINADNTGAIRMGGGVTLGGLITLTGDARIGGGGSYFFSLPDVDANNIPDNAVGTVLSVANGNLISGGITGDFAMSFGATGNVGGGGTNVFLGGGSSNTWTGETTIVGREGAAGQGTLNLAANESIPDGVGKGNLSFGTPAINSGSNTRLNLNGRSETINGLSTANHAFPGIASIQNNSFGATIIDTGGVAKKEYQFTAGPLSTLTVGNWDASAVFGGIIRDADPDLTYTLPNPDWDGSADPLDFDAADVDGDAFTVTGVVNPAIAAGSKVALTKIGTGVQTLSGANTYTGATTVNGGALAVTGSLNTASPVTVNSGGTIAGAGDGATTGIVGAVTVNSGGRVAPGSTGPGTIGTLHLSSLAVTSGNVHIDFGGGSSDQVNVLGTAGFTGANTITPFGSPTAGIYTVIQSTSAITGANTLTLNPFPIIPNTRGASGTLNLSDPNAVKINVTGGAKTLTWVGNVNNEWDLIGDANWTDGSPQQFFNQDVVIFNNSSANPNPVQLVGDLEPSTVTVDATRNYTFAGTGSITGITGLTKSGTGTLTISNINGYSGVTAVNGGVVSISDSGNLGNASASNTISFDGGTLHSTGAAVNLGSTRAIALGSGGGTLEVTGANTLTVPGVVSGANTLNKTGTGTLVLSGTSSYSGATNILAGTVRVTDDVALGDALGGAVTVSSGATLDLGGSTTANAINFGAKQFSVAGTGVGGQGVLINSNADVGQINAYQQVILTAPATFGGPGRFDIRGAGASLSLQNNTLTKTGASQFSLVGVAVDDGNIVVNEGTFAMETSTSVLDNVTGTKFTFNDGTTLQFFDKAAGLVSRPMEFNGGVTVRNGDVDSVSTFESRVTMNGSATYTWANNATAANDIVQTGIISESGGPRGIEVKTNNAFNTLALGGDNTFTGSVALSGPGKLTISPPSGIGYFGNTANVSLDTTSILELNFGGNDVIGALLVNGVSLAPGLYGAGGTPLAQLTGTGTLQVSGQIILPGDFDGNNKVDAGDYVFWRNNEGTFNTLANDPLSGTEVDGDQYNIWRANFGNTFPGSGGSTELAGQVPEPATVMLVLLAAGAVALVGRRRPVGRLSN